MDPKTEQTDKGLASYYQARGVDYYDEEGIGKFAKYCDDNGFDDDQIEEELDQEQAEDCMLVDFDENFPFKSKPDDENKGKEIIFDIITRCYQGETFNDAVDFNIDAEHWNISKQEMEQTIKICQEQCPSICNNQMAQDNNIMSILSIGHKLNIPFLQFLVDMYSRDRIKMDHAASPQQWAKTNKYCSDLQKQNRLIVEHAIGSFNHRIAPKLMLDPPSKIEDSLSDVADYIAAAVNFVASLAVDDKSTCPFQIDFAFIFDSVQNVKNSNNDDNDDNDDSDDGDDDEKEDDFFDCFDDIKEKLNEAEVLYLSQIRDKEEEKKEDVATLQIFKNHFDLFRRKEIKKKYKDKDKAFDEYPRNHRFVALIDRRIPNEENASFVTKEDEITFFEPSLDSKELPNHAIPLWFFESSKTCIIPGKISEFGTESMQKMKDETKTSVTGCKGSLFILSFHVTSAEQIRCYLYLNGQLIRFLPDDIINLLPKYFHDNEENKDFIDDGAKKLIESMRGKLKDSKFESFYKKYKCV